MNANGIPDLGAAGRGKVMIIQHRVLTPNGVDILPGGLLDEAAVAHVRLVDLLTGRGYYAPLRERSLPVLADQLAGVIETANAVMEGS